MSSIVLTRHNVAISLRYYSKEYQVTHNVLSIKALPKSPMAFLLSSCYGSLFTIGMILSFPLALQSMNEFTICVV